MENPGRDWKSPRAGRRLQSTRRVVDHPGRNDPKMQRSAVGRGNWRVTCSAEPWRRARPSARIYCSAMSRPRARRGARSLPAPPAVSNFGKVPRLPRRCLRRDSVCAKELGFRHRAVDGIPDNGADLGTCPRHCIRTARRRANLAPQAKRMY